MRTETDVELVDLRQIDTNKVQRHDQAFFPSGRTAFLHAWIEKAGHQAPDLLRRSQLVAYGVVCPCLTGCKMGPLFADHPEFADRRLQAFMTRVPASSVIFLDIRETNPHALMLVQHQGMAPMFETARMSKGAKGAPALPDMARTYGITSFEMGGQPAWIPSSAAFETIRRQRAPERRGVIDPAGKFFADFTNQYGPATAVKPGLPTLAFSTAPGNDSVDPFRLPADSASIQGTHMTTIKKRLFLTSILATVGSLAVGRTALAATGSGDSSSARGEPARRNRKHPGAERGANRLEQLKTELGITPEQEPAWNAYSQAMQPKDRSGDEKRPEFSKLTTPERIEYMQSRQSERQQHMNQRLDAVKSFYGQLTPEQQIIYDQKMMHAWDGKSHGQGRHRGRRRS